MDNKATRKPYFSFSVDVQSHGTYATEYRLGEEEYLVGEKYSTECKKAMDNYMHMIMDSDEQLVKFVHVFGQEEEPVVLLLFSDHLPWMGNGNVFCAEMGLDFSQESEEIDHL